MGLLAWFHGLQLEFVRKSLLTEQQFFTLEIAAYHDDGSDVLLSRGRFRLLWGAPDHWANSTNTKEHLRRSALCLPVSSKII